MIDAYPFTVQVMENGNIWISREGGEGMEVEMDSFVALIEQFWIDYF